MSRTEGIVLVGLRGDEYWFIDSVFEHTDGLAGCTGVTCFPVSEEYADELLEVDSVAERYSDYWGEENKDKAEDDCEACEGWLQEEGCDYCDYQSLEDFCYNIISHDGIESMIDNAGDAYVEGIKGTGETDVKYADCTGCGRIFGTYGQDKPLDADGFDEVYNMGALVACLAYEDGAVSYDYAVKAIFGDRDD